MKVSVLLALLLHICDHNYHWGPLWGFSAFGLNGHLMGHICATYRMADQLLLSLNILHAIDALQHKLFMSQTTKTLNFLQSEPVKCGKELIPGTYIVNAILKRNMLQLKMWQEGGQLIVNFYPAISQTHCFILQKNIAVDQMDKIVQCAHSSTEEVNSTERSRNFVWLNQNIWYWSIHLKLMDHSCIPLVFQEDKNSKVTETVIFLAHS